MNNTAVDQQQKTVKPKQRRGSRSPVAVQISQKSVPKSRAEYIRELRQNWEDAP